MADSLSLETQIDCFLEQFKLSASKAMEQQETVSAIVRSHSSHLDSDMTDNFPSWGSRSYLFQHIDAKSVTEEIELQNPVMLQSLSMGDIAELLRAQYAIITGGKSREGCPLITFPDHSNFHMLTDSEYQQLMLYLTSVPSLQEADLGFHLIVDRRKDRWNSVKTVLLKISVYFPGLIHVVYVIRPTSFLQKALSEVSNKLFKEEFKFRVIVLSTVEELHEYIDINQLTSDLGGILLYSHEEWIQQRIVLERVDDISLTCEKRIESLKLLISSLSRPIPTVPVEPLIPLNRAVLRKANTISKIESTGETVHLVSSELNDQIPSPEIDGAQLEVRRAKRGHVLNELLETERIYVVELLSILKGYKMEAQSEEMQPLLPPGLLEKIDILFGNLDELYHFHAEVFLTDLENCISTTDLVALCFVQRRDVFYRLYSYYCQNIPRSEQLREALVDSNMFFQTCQRKLGHKLPLAAYLLKPVQRITKYQLLLKDLLRYSDEKKSCKELQQALDCMLVVLRCVNDSMHQISISGFPVDLSQQGDLLLQGSFSVWTESKKDLKLRLKPTQRHIFLYQKAVLFCKPTSKTTHNKSMYHFKHYLKMSQIGLTESVKGDIRKFELWLQGRQEVHTIQASTVEQKQIWVNEIKRVLLNQLEELKGEKIKQYTAHAHKTLRQTTSWEKQKITVIPHLNNHRTMSCDSETHSPTSTLEEESLETIEGGNWSSDCSNSEDEEQPNNTAILSGRYVALADYCAVGISEVNMKDGDIVELLKVGCAGWWFVKVIGTSCEGWAPAAYLENIHRKSSRSSSRSQDKLHDH